MVLTAAPRRWLARAAAGADAPVFLVCGTGSGTASARLRQSHRVRLVDSPRSATVLVVAGRVHDAMVEPLARVHDQLAWPRATVWCTGGPAADVTATWPHATVVGPGGDVEAAVLAAHRALFNGGRPSESPLLADVEPAQWRGVGPYGQGGSAMTGGVPYGRPVAGRSDDRDGLTLDVVPVRIGPWFPAFPPGLVLTVTFAGDVVQAVEVTGWPSPDGPGVGAPLPDDPPDPLAILAERSVAVADLEVARARHHLRWLAQLLHLYGLDALARRVLGAADRASPRDAGEVAALQRHLERPWLLGRVTAGVGAITGGEANEWGGPVARAAGVPIDERLRSPAYAALGFQPVTFAAGDIRDRWRQRLAEASEALELAGRAGDRAVAPGEPVEWPAPLAPTAAGTSLVAMLTGAEWGDAVATVASLDLNVGASVESAAAP